MPDSSSSSVNGPPNIEAVGSSQTSVDQDPEELRRTKEKLHLLVREQLRHYCERGRPKWKLSHSEEALNLYSELDGVKLSGGNFCFLIKNASTVDKFTYFTQFFWSCLFLFTFYILICNDGDGVLGISRILKLQNQLVSHRENNIRSNNPKSLEDILLKGFSTGVSYMYYSLFEVSPWCNAVDLLGKRRKITLISYFGEISGSRGMERNIFYLISKSSYSTSSIATPPPTLAEKHPPSTSPFPCAQKPARPVYEPLSDYLTQSHEK
ncbi:hypothetical protein ACSBR2_004569 [Camellia fascicularis]